MHYQVYCFILNGRISGQADGQDYWLVRLTDPIRTQFLNTGYFFPGLWDKRLIEKMDGIL